MTVMQHFLEKHWKRGLAVGSSDIRTDSIEFVFEKEKFRFPALEVMDLCEQNGTFYTVKVKKLRALRK